MVLPTVNSFIGLRHKQLPEATSKATKKNVSIILHNVHNFRAVTTQLKIKLSWNATNENCVYLAALSTTAQSMSTYWQLHLSTNIVHFQQYSPKTACISFGHYSRGQAK
jgi:hypothetical protein